MGRLAAFGKLNEGARVTRSELIAGLAADNPHLRAADVELIVSTIFDEVTAALARGERVELRGFGAFTVKRRDARAKTCSGIDRLRRRTHHQLRQK